MGLIDNSFDFDEWAELASGNQQAFERRRNELIENLISQSTDAKLRRRLQGIQFKIDLHRQLAKTPIQSCLKISSMMWSSLLDEGGLKDALDSLLNSEAEEPQKLNATILPFKLPD